MIFVLLCILAAYGILLFCVASGFVECPSFLDVCERGLSLFVEQEQVHVSLVCPHCGSLSPIEEGVVSQTAKWM